MRRGVGAVGAINETIVWELRLLPAHRNLEYYNIRYLPCALIVEGGAAQLDLEPDFQPGTSCNFIYCK